MAPATIGAAAAGVACASQSPGPHMSVVEQMHQAGKAWEFRARTSADLAGLADPSRSAAFMEDVAQSACERRPGSVGPRLRTDRS